MKTILIILLTIRLEVVAAPKATSVIESHLFSTQIIREAGIGYLISLPSGYNEGNQKWPLIFY
jgi:hypothetical protein